MVAKGVVGQERHTDAEQRQRPAAGSGPALAVDQPQQDRGLQGQHPGQHHAPMGRRGELESRERQQRKPQACRYDHRHRLRRRQPGPAVARRERQRGQEGARVSQGRHVPRRQQPARAEARHQDETGPDEENAERASQTDPGLARHRRAPPPPDGRRMASRPPRLTPPVPLGRATLPQTTLTENRVDGRMTSVLGARSRRGWMRGGGAVGFQGREARLNVEGVERSYPSTPSESGSRPKSRSPNKTRTGYAMDRFFRNSS